jgi:hypothetical protein
MMAQPDVWWLSLTYGGSCVIYSGSSVKYGGISVTNAGCMVAVTWHMASASDVVGSKVRRLVGSTTVATIEPRVYTIVKVD